MAPNGKHKWDYWCPHHGQGAHKQYVCVFSHSLLSKSTRRAEKTTSIKLGHLPSYQHSLGKILPMSVYKVVCGCHTDKASSLC